MRNRWTVVAAVVLGIASLDGLGARAATPSPAESLGMAVGQNRVLVSYSETVRYLQALASGSPRLRLLEVGPTVEGRTMRAVVISSPGNLARLEELRGAWRAIADPRGTTRDSLERLVATTPSCALITAGIHANEVAGPQAAIMFAHRLATSASGSREAAWLERTVVLLVPSLNPDGQEAVVAWYRRWLGTPFEGSNLPGLYHRYAGHDNNRDFVYLTQPESRALNRFVYREWRPQVFLDLHQMGSAGPRQFVPPFADPIAPTVHPLVWRVTSHLGTLMALRLEQAGRAGVVSGWTFDGSWIGGTRNTGWWKNVFGVLTETANAALASPIDVDANELRGGGKGLADYQPQVNFPNPWHGGTWGLADAVAYQLDIMGAFVEFAADRREDLLRGVEAMAAEAIRRGASGAPRAWLVPLAEAPDPGRARRLVDLLVEGGAEARVASGELRIGNARYPAGTVVFPADQPLRQFLAEVLGRQSYPEVEPAAGAGILLPYDVTAWSVPLALGVPVVASDAAPLGPALPISAALPAAPAPAAGIVAVRAGHLAAFSAAGRALARDLKVYRTAAPTEVSGVEPLGAGSFVIAGPPERVQEVLRESAADGVVLRAVPEGARTFRRIRIGVFHPDFGLEDAGWLRWAIDRLGLAAEVVDPSAVAAGNLRQRLDVLLVPPVDGKVLTDGPRVSGAVLPPAEFRRGIGRQGIEALRAFLKAGGTVVGFAASAEWLADTLELPVSNPLKGLKREEFFAPGALVAVDVDPASPIGLGMPPRVAAMVEAPVAFQTRPSGTPGDRVVAVRFPEREMLMSGWLRGEDRLRRRAAAVTLRVEGQGTVVLFAFAPYFRGQTEACFPLLYNAVFQAAEVR